MNRVRSKILASKGIISDTVLSQKQPYKSNFSSEKYQDSQKFRDKMSQITNRQKLTTPENFNLMKQTYQNAFIIKSHTLSRQDQNRQLQQLVIISNPRSIYQQKQPTAKSYEFGISRQLPRQLPNLSAPLASHSPQATNSSRQRSAGMNNNLKKQQEQQILATSIELMILPLTSSLKMTQSQDRSKRGTIKQNNINININIIQNAVQEYKQNHNVTNVYFQREPPSTKSSLNYEECDKFKNIRNIDGLKSVSRSTNQPFPIRDHTPPLQRGNVKIKSKQTAVTPPAEVKLEEDKKSQNRRNIIKKQYSTQSEYRGITKAERQAAIRFNELMNFNWNDKIQKLNNDINQVRDLQKRHKMAMIEQPAKKAEKVVHFNLPGEENQQ